MGMDSYFKRILLVVTCLLLCDFLEVFGQSSKVHLSDSAAIYLITCEPDVSGLVSSFGHSALRVQDPILKIDDAYDFGVIDIEDGFFLNLIQNKLTSQVKVIPYYLFRFRYRFFERQITEQKILLTSSQRQKIFELLSAYASQNRPEYHYLYFKNNCTTKLRDIIEIVVPLTNQPLTENKSTYRSLLKPYWKNKWIELLFDLCFGIPTDRKLESGEDAFLPFVLRDYLEKRGLIDPIPGGVLRYEPDYLPLAVTSLICLALLALTMSEYRRKRVWLAINYLVLTVTGFSGIFLLICWIVFGHHEMSWNLNLIWLSPTNLIFIFVNNQSYFKIIGGQFATFLIFWFTLPQELNSAIAPLLFGLSVRFIVISRL